MGVEYFVGNFTDYSDFCAFGSFWEYEEFFVFPEAGADLIWGLYTGVYCCYSFKVCNFVLVLAWVSLLNLLGLETAFCELYFWVFVQWLRFLEGLLQWCKC